MTTSEIIYRFTYICNGKHCEEFYKTLDEAEYWRENIAKLAGFADEFDSLKYENVSKVRGASVWHNLRETASA